MKKILTIGILCLMFVGIVVASYDFNYDRPTSNYANKLFNMSRDMGSDNEFVIMAYEINSDKNFWMGKAIRAEEYIKELELEIKLKLRNSGGGTRTVIEYINTCDEEFEDSPEDYANGDMNGDCTVDLEDLKAFGNKFLPRMKPTMELQKTISDVLDEYGIKGTTVCSNDEPEEPEEDVVYDESDLNKDGKVDTTDSVIWATWKGTLDNEYGRTDCSSVNEWCDGADWTKDGKVDTTDLVRLADIRPQL